MRLLSAMTLVMLIGLGVPGCGPYSGSSGRVDEGIQRVAVQYLDNLTAEPNIGVVLADNIISAIQLDNTLKVVDEADADTIISGKVVRYALREQSPREDLTVTEYQVQIAVVLTMSMRATGEKIFSKKRFTGTGNYYLEDDGVTSEVTARELAAKEIVSDILALVVNDW